MGGLVFVKVLNAPRPAVGAPYR